MEGQGHSRLRRPLMALAALTARRAPVASTAATPPPEWPRAAAIKLGSIFFVIQIVAAVTVAVVTDNPLALIGSPAASFSSIYLANWMLTGSLTPR